MISRALVRASAIGNVNVADAAALDMVSAKSRDLMSDPPALRWFVMLDRIMTKPKGRAAVFPDDHRFAADGEVRRLPTGKTVLAEDVPSRGAKPHSDHAAERS